MEDQDYKQLVDTAAKNEYLEQEDLNFLASYFEKSIDRVVEDVINRRILIALADNAVRYLN